MPGLQGSDEVTYARWSLLLSQGDWRLGDWIVSRRFGYFLPVSGLIGIFGVSSSVLFLFPLLCSLLEIGAVWLIGHMVVGPKGGLVAAALLACLPMHVAAPGFLTPDSALALTATAAFACVLKCRSTGSHGLAAMAGALAGYGVWLKDKGAVFILGIAVLSIALLRRRGLFATVGFAMVAVIALYGALLFLLSGEPLYLFESLTDNLRTRYGTGGVSQAQSSALAYPLIFVTRPHHYGLLPFLALLGIATAFVGRLANDRTRLLAVWSIGLFALYSLMPASLSPLTLIPKQTNYALYFMGPLAVLAALFIVGTGRLGSLLLLAACSIGVAGAALEQHQARIHMVNVPTALSILDEAESTNRFSNAAVINANTFRGVLMGDLGAIRRIQSAERLTSSPLDGDWRTDDLLVIDRQSQRQPVPITESPDAPLCSLPAPPPNPPPATLVTFVVNQLESLFGDIPDAIAPLRALHDRLLLVKPIEVYRLARDCVQ